MVTFNDFRTHGPERADLASALINADADGRSAISSFVTLWMGFNGWMECVTNVHTDALMVNALANHGRITNAYIDLMEQHADFRSYVLHLASMWPVLNVRDVRRRLGQDAFLKYGFVEIREMVVRQGVKHEPQDWITGNIPTWPQLFRAIYCIRCNLIHGAKSPHASRDHLLVVGADRVLRTFIEHTNCLEWHD